MFYVPKTALTHLISFPSILNFRIIRGYNTCKVLVLRINTDSRISSVTCNGRGSIIVAREDYELIFLVYSHGDRGDRLDFDFLSIIMGDSFNF